MIKVIIGVLFVTTATFAQNVQTPAANKKAGVAVRPTGSTESTTKSKSTSATAASTKPFPKPAGGDNLKSGDTNIPSYEQEKEAGIHKGRAKYPARKTPTTADVNAMTKKKS